MRGARWLALALAALALTGCETTAEKSAKLERQAGHVTLTEKGLSITRESTDVKVLSTAVVRGAEGAAAVVSLNNRSSRTLRNVPIAITVKDAGGRTLFQNNGAGLESALVSLPSLPAHARVVWVDDQLPASGAPASVSARVGEGPRVERQPPGLKIEVTAHLSEDPANGPSATGTVSNRSTIASRGASSSTPSRARRADRRGGAGVVPELGAGASRRFQVFLVGDAAGRSCRLSAPPDELRLDRARRQSPRASARRARRALLERDALEHVRDRLARVDGGLERLEDVLPADHDHRVDAAREQRGDAVALQAVALVLQAVDLDQVRAELGARAQAAQRLGDLLAGADEHVGELDRLLHRRLDAVQAELRRGLLGVVDDVVERRRQRVAVAGVERRAHAPAGQAVDDVVGDAVAFLLADLQVLGERRVLGVVDEQVVQQQAASAARCARPPPRGTSGPGRRRGAGSSSGEDIAPREPIRALSRFFYGPITSLQLGTHTRVTGWQPWRAFPRARTRCTPASWRSGSATDSCSPAGARCGCRCASSSCSSRWLGRIGAIATREELYATVWGGELRHGDRSVDVYVSKLRGKLEEAMPDRRFIHTHPGFGYRFQPQPSREQAAGVLARAGQARDEADLLSRNVHIGSTGA